MLDVWSETQTEAVQKYVYTDRVAEISSSVGYEGGVALYMPQTATEKIQGVEESFWVFRNPEIAGQFGQLLTFRLSIVTKSSLVKFLMILRIS